MLYLNSRVGYHDITDGPAHTILLGEIESVGPTLGWVSGTRSTLRNTGEPLGKRDPGTLAGGNTSMLASRSIRSEDFEVIEALAEDGSWPRELSGGFASAHSLSSNFLFCDGSVRPVKQTVAMEVYRRLGNRADGDLLSAEQF